MFADLFYVLDRLNWNDAVDILLVALIFYWLLSLLQGTKAVQLLRGIFFLVVAAVTVTSFLDLTAFRWLVTNSLPALLVAIPVIFQPELRRALVRLGQTRGLLIWSNQEQALDLTLRAVSQAAQKIAAAGDGAIIVLERETGLEDYIETGIRLDAVVSAELLATIFHHNTDLHDGAVIIRQSRIVAASCLLPLGRFDRSETPNMGTRHRAALGLTEATDAVVVVVSEETAVISIAYDGRIIRNLDRLRLLKVLRAFYRGRLQSENQTWAQLRQRWPFSLWDKKS